MFCPPYLEYRQELIRRKSERKVQLFKILIGNRPDAFSFRARRGGVAREMWPRVKRLRLCGAALERRRKNFFRELLESCRRGVLLGARFFRREQSVVRALPHLDHQRRGTFRQSHARER